MNVKYLTQVDEKRWDDYIDQHPAAKIYHKTAWKRIIEKSFGKETFYLFAEENDSVYGALPLVKFFSLLTGKMIISLPYVNYGGMLYSNEKAKQLLLSEAAALRQRLQADAVELRSTTADGYDCPVKTNKVTFLLDLPATTEELMQGFKAKLRSQIRRPQKEGMHSKVGRAELLHDFYNIFCRNMRDLGTPVYSRKFFETIFAELPDQAKIIIVYSSKNEPVASAFLLQYKTIMEIPWASSLKKYNHLSPNMLLYFEVLSEAVRCGNRTFDFGRGTRDGGTHHFKEQWGGKEVQLYWYYLLKEGEHLPDVSKENPKYAMAIGIWQKLPLFIANIFGPPIVKNLP